MITQETDLYINLKAMASRESIPIGYVGPDNSTDGQKKGLVTDYLVTDKDYFNIVSQFS